MPMLMNSGNSCPGLFVWYACLEGRRGADKSLQEFNGPFAYIPPQEGTEAQA